MVEESLTGVTKEKRMQRTFISTLGVLGLVAGTPGLNAQQAGTSRVSRLLWDLVIPVQAPAVGPPMITATEPESSEVQVAQVPTFNDTVIITAIANESPETLATDLEALGATDISVAGRLVSARVPLSVIPSLEGLSQLRFARPGLALANAGLVTSQADGAMYADQARATYSVAGNGIRVGILSDSFNALGGMDEGIASGDLPTDILILRDVGNRPDEGRAMGEIVHDVAPGASLAFHTAWEGEASFANGIRALQAVGCRVIVDDVIYLEEPMFADGIVAQAVDEVRAAGVAYFSAAGNAARASYESPFRGVAGGYHDFDQGSGTDTIFNMAVPGGTYWIVLQWADSYASTSLSSPGAASDLDIELVYPDGRTMFDPLGFPQGGFASNTGQDPTEVFGVVSSGILQAGLRIRHKSGPLPPALKIVFYGSYPSNPGEYDTRSSTLAGHANAFGAMAVGAVRYCKTPAYNQNPPLIEYFSSAGGLGIRYAIDGTALPTPEVRQKPEFCAPQGGDNTFFGADSDCTGKTGFPNFYGTSAAAPHAAGIAALMLEARPNTQPDRLRRVLQDTAVDMKTAGFDFDSGYGLVQADAALEQLTQPPPVLQSVVSRKTHGTSGTQDLQLSLAAPYGIECRSGDSLTLIARFDCQLSSAQVALSQGTAIVDSTTVEGSVVRISLSGVANRKWLTLSINDVVATTGGYLAAIPVHLGRLEGDVNGNGAVTTADVNLIKYMAGRSPDLSCFRADINANGAITTADINLSKYHAGSTLP